MQAQFEGLQNILRACQRSVVRGIELSRPIIWFMNCCSICFFSPLLIDFTYIQVAIVRCPNPPEWHRLGYVCIIISICVRAHRVNPQKYIWSSDGPLERVRNYQVWTPFNPFLAHFLFSSLFGRRYDTKNGLGQLYRSRDFGGVRCDSNQSDQCKLAD